MGRLQRQLLTEFPFTWAKGVGDRFQRRGYESSELFVSLSNSLKQHAQEVEAYRRPYWRLVHLVIGKPDPGLIKIDGMRMRQLYAFFDRDAAQQIGVAQTYAVRVDALERLVNAAMEAHARSPDTHQEI